MNLNHHFENRVLLHTDAIPWQSSPMVGVERRMLDRIGDEVARATTIVRYAAGSEFSPHTHDAGEEFLVLDGVFQDEHGDFPAGTYVRNPPTSRHKPGSAAGCVIFVKLRQFFLEDRTVVTLDTNEVSATPEANRTGVSVIPLFKDRRENVRVERWAAGQSVSLELAGGGEFLVLDGRFEEGGEVAKRRAWLRLPAGATLEATAGPAGCRLWVKTGHLPP